MKQKKSCLSLGMAVAKFNRKIEEAGKKESRK
jgi:hypothetical protein